MLRSLLKLTFSIPRTFHLQNIIYIMWHYSLRIVQFLQGNESANTQSLSIAIINYHFLILYKFMQKMFPIQFST